SGATPWPDPPQRTTPTRRRCRMGVVSVGLGGSVGADGPEDVEDEVHDVIGLVAHLLQLVGAVAALLRGGGHERDHLGADSLAHESLGEAADDLGGDEVDGLAAAPGGVELLDGAPDDAAVVDVDAVALAHLLAVTGNERGDS